MFDILDKNSLHFVENTQNIKQGKLGHYVTFYDYETDISSYDFVILCINETRGNNYKQGAIDFEEIKQQLYNLTIGHWQVSILDLGYINPGHALTDTYFATKQILQFILKSKSIPIVLGGSQDVLYAQYRAYDGIKNMVNLGNIDYKFNLGDSNQTMHNESFLSHMIVHKPYNLFNFCNIGYQTFLNPNQELELLDKMFFEAYRLGQIAQNPSIAEPVLRDMDVVSIDIRSVQSQSLFQEELQPNGFNNREICTLVRYAGLSGRVSSFSIFELQFLSSLLSKKLVAQMIWYFIEGTKFRFNEVAEINNPNFLKYKVLVENEVVVFYESQLSERWWIEIPSNFNNQNNKLKQHTLLPCDKDDYVAACNNLLSDRWLKARKKNEI